LLEAVLQTRDSVVNVWGDRTPYSHEPWPQRVDENTVEPPQAWVQSACVLCANGCGLDIGVTDGRIVGVRGRGVDRVNRGRLGPKGLHGWMANQHGDRLTRPLVRRGDRLEQATWDEAMELVVRNVKQLKDRFGGGSIGFYNTGQLFLEEYYTLSIIGDAGVGTPHMDGNTRLCTATASFANIESFGSDGPPGSLADVDVTECILHIGHNIAETQTVQWMRVLDRRRGTNPPRLIAIDPRRTPVAAEADVHLAPRLGTNVPLLNALQHELIRNGHVDRAWVEAHTAGFEALEQTVAAWTPDRAAETCDIPADQIREAAAILGTTPSLVSTVLQGVYQSNQATAAAVQVNNIHLLRGLIGKPGSTVFQMSGQPTAMNTRETGANGELVAYRNWDNPKHIEELARHWNVEPAVLPHYAPPTHAMQMFRYAELGSLRMLWILATNPAVSLPELDRVRRIVGKNGLFVVVNDAFLTETAQLADVVLPAAIWGEKMGTFTNTDRTVHLSLKAIDPPGEARPDFDILLDFARQMDFRDKDGAALVKWSTPEGAFDHWKGCSKGRPCDYSGLSYAMLEGGSGIQWPCSAEYPEGRERLYTDGVFNTDSDYCETYGHDLLTGAAITEEEHRAHNPRGKALLKAAEYVPPAEQPDAEYPLWLTTGRTVYHFHTRTKTGRSPQLQGAAPDAWVQVAAEDAGELGIREGDWLAVETRRGRIEVMARIGDIRRGHIFVPFHYGYWDEEGRKRAANELTITGWDPVSKQPHFKYAAARLRKLGGNA
jgi:anaerobic selenocysteine-containing dehydrogenase